jgi:integrase-like protein
LTQPFLKNVIVTTRLEVGCICLEMHVAGSIRQEQLELVAVPRGRHGIFGAEVMRGGGIAERISGQIFDRVCDADHEVRIFCEQCARREESFMKTLKYEEVHLFDYPEIEHARRRIGSFLEDVYNQKRLHSALGYQPPEEFEQQYFTTNTVELGTQLPESLIPKHQNF